MVRYFFGIKIRSSVKNSSGSFASYYTASTQLVKVNKILWSAKNFQPRFMVRPLLYQQILENLYQDHTSTNIFELT